MNQKSKKTAKRDGAKKQASKPAEPEPEQKAESATLFEFYKIYPYGQPRGGMQSCETRLCDPPCQRVSKINLQIVLETTCAEAYAEGYFIALRVGADSKGQPQGLPDAFWLIRVKPNEHGLPCRKAEQIPLDNEDHEHLETLKRIPALIQVSPEDKQRERESIAPEEETGKLIEIEGQPYIVTRDELVKFDHQKGYDYQKNPWAALFREYKHSSERSDLDDAEWRRLGDPYQWQRGVLASQMAAKHFDLMPDPEFKDESLHEYVRRRKFGEDAPKKVIVAELVGKGLKVDDADRTYRNAMRGPQKARNKEQRKQTSVAKKATPTSRTKSRSKKK
jgi:hypothetical protein